MANKADQFNAIDELSYDFPEYPYQLVEKNALYSEQNLALMDNALKNSYFRAHGFQFCGILDGSLFDSLTQIKALRGSVAEVNPDISTFINIIDSRAYEIYRNILKKNHKAISEEVKRLFRK